MITAKATTVFCLIYYHNYVRNKLPDVLAQNALIEDQNLCPIHQFYSENIVSAVYICGNESYGRIWNANYIDARSCN